ncbi:hypothetical protein YC2023_037911 [Brassica napus]
MATPEKDSHSDGSRKYDSDESDLRFDKRRNTGKKDKDLVSIGSPTSEASRRGRWIKSYSKRSTERDIV